MQRAGLRPEHLEVLRSGPGIPAQIVLAEHLGDVCLLHLRVEGVQVLLNAKVSSGHDQWQTGQAVQITPATGCTIAFDHQGLRID